jgi:hypothetical protein
LDLNLHVDTEEWVGWPAPHYGKHMKNFKFADASIIGTMHDQMGRNNQDCGILRVEDDFSVGVVCDGCGSTMFSEVGATLGSQLAVEFLAIQMRVGIYNLEQEGPTNALLNRTYSFVRDSIAKTIGSIQLSEDAFLRLVQNNFLFTLVGFVIGKKYAMAFSIGDGYIKVNDEEVSIKEPDNMPTYLAYSLTPEREKWDTMPKMRYRLPTEEVESIVIATDGIDDFIGSANRPLPGKIQECVPSLEDILRNDTYFTAPIKLQRLLAKMNPITRPSVRAQGLLKDDTTIIMARRFDVL